MPLRAVIFDLDGVLVDTAVLHARAWKSAFDRVLDAHGVEREFDPVGDYRIHVDGKPRYEGARDFLRSRGIELPWGDAGDDPGLDTVCAVGNLKNRSYHRLLDERGIDPLAGTLELLDGLRSRGIAVAVVSSSRNAARVLEAAGLSDRLAVRVDGTDLAAGGLPGKPDPAMFIAAADRLGVDPGAAVVIEDAESGVEAGRRGGFGLVVGIGAEHADRLRAHGADLVVEGLADLAPDPSRWAAAADRRHGRTREESP